MPVTTLRHGPILAQAAVIFSLIGLAPNPSNAGAAAPSQAYVWRNVTVVAGGFVPGIEFSPVEKGLIYCRTDIGGAYRWDSSKNQWIPITDWVGPSNSENYLGIESIAPDPKDGAKVYIAAGTYSNGPAAIFRSSDRGAHFEITPMPLTMGGNENGRGVGERLAVDPNNTRILYFGSRRDGLWKSEDAAEHWQKVDSFPIKGTSEPLHKRQPRWNNKPVDAGLSFVVIDPNSGVVDGASKAIYVGVAQPGAVHLYQSSDEGRSWQPVTGQPGNFLPLRGKIDADGVLYVTYSDGVGPYGVENGSVWKLETRSGKWSEITPKTDGEPHSGFSGLSLDREHPGTLAVATMNHYSGSGDDVFRSTDGGKTWESMREHSKRDPSLSPYLNWGGTAKLGWWMAALAIDPFDSNHCLYGTGATIWGSDDFTNLDRNQDTHWFVAAKGMEETAVLDLISPPSGPHLISGFGDIGGFRHDDFSVSPPTGMSSNPIFTNTAHLDFAERAPNVVVRDGTSSERAGATLAYSSDGGATWVPIEAPAASRRQPPTGRPRVNPTLVVSSDGKVLLVTTAQGSEISTDVGKTWSLCHGLFPGAHPFADRAADEAFYALDEPNHKMYASADGGKNFSSRDVSGLPPQTEDVFRHEGPQRIRSVPDREGDFWLAAWGPAGLFHSTDGAQSFSPIETIQDVGAFGFGKAAPGRNYPAIYASGKVGDVVGVFRSDDQGDHWVRINDEAHQYGFPPMAVIGDPRIYGRAYLGNNGRGILYGDIAAPVSP